MITLFIHKTFPIIPTVFILCLLTTSCKEQSTSVEQKSPQDVVVRVLYSGTARAMSFDTHNIFFEIYDLATSNTIKRTTMAAHPDNLKNGKSIIFSSINPGNYKLYVFWDWDNSGTINPESYEPSTVPYPLDLTVEGYGTVNQDVTLIDRTSPSDMGWLSTSISYSGSLPNFPAYHKLMVRVADLSFNKIAEGQANVIGFVANPFTSQHYMDVSPGGPYYVLAWWDTNDDGSNTGDPHSSWSSPILVSPGLPTVGITLDIP